MNALFFLPILTFLAHSNGDGGIKFKDLGIDEIRYTYHDSSVPPPYHRSYTITVTADNVHIVVDSYGDIVADKQFPSTADQLQSLVLLLDECQVKNVKNKEEKGCTGGTGESISCLKEGSTVFNGNAYHCGGEIYGNLKGNISDFKAAVKALIPDFEQVLDRK